MTSWLLHLTPDQVVHNQALAQGTLCCVPEQGTNLTLTMLFAIQVCKCTDEFNAGGNPAMDWHPIYGGVEKLLVTPC